MPQQNESLLECSFLIPVCRDSELSDGGKHDHYSWEWLRSEMYDRFRGVTMGPGYYTGYYQDPDTGGRIADRSLKFVVAIPENRVDELRRLLAAACVVFSQKCIYLSLAGRVEFIEKQDETSG